jgi:hypothetical protein
MVYKDFTDNNAASVTVSLVCGGGASVSPASAPASEATPAVFTVQGYTGDPVCTATESSVPPGYSSTGTCNATMSVGSCTIVNTLVAPGAGGGTPNPVGGVAGLLEAPAQAGTAEDSGGGGRSALALLAASGLVIAIAGAWLGRRRGLGQRPRES